MSYGLYDGDLKLYPSVPVFNLELMKLSTYYKHKREIVSFTPRFIPERYSNFLVRQDYPSQKYLPYRKNVVYGGRAYDGWKYKPLPIEIESCAPDISIYNTVDKYMWRTQEEPKLLTTMRNALHVRLSLDEQNLWSKLKCQIPKETRHNMLMLHDFDLAHINGGLEMIHELLEEFLIPSRQRVGMKFPVQVTTESDLLPWYQLLPSGKFYSIQYNGTPQLEWWPELISKSSSPSVIKQTTLNVTANTTYNKFITQDIVCLMRTIATLRSQALNFSLIYDDNFFHDKRWIQVMKLLDLYTDHCRALVEHRTRYTRLQYDTMYSFLAHATDKDYKNFNLAKQDVIETFQFVREQNYELFTLFYENKE